jgi:signal transduction histidine kinase
MGQRGVRIVTRLDETLPPVLGHADALQQVLLNLVTNARDAMGEGEIRIETSRVEGRPDWLCLRVSDDGPGIPPETLPHIFDPFYTTKPTGTGLGLSVSYGIIRDHNGTVDVQSTPGKGTTFILTFPALREGN